MTLAHRIALDPTEEQRIYFAEAAGTARFTWNWAVAEWNAQRTMGGKPKASELGRYFNSIKYERFPWLKDIHRDAHSRPFLNLKKALSGFFSGRSKRPVFKKKGKSRDSFYVANDHFTINAKSVRLPRIGNIKMMEDLRFTGKIHSSTVTRDADRWFISIIIEMPDVKVCAPVGGPVGVDLGITAFAVLSTGEKIIAPRPLRRAQRKLRRLGRWHARKQLQSQNRCKATMKLARQHRHIRNVRQDFIHKFTTRLVKEHSEICIEDLNVTGMVKNHNLALHIGDVAWGETRRQLGYKAVLYGSLLTVRNRFFASSKKCHNCEFVNFNLTLKDRQWDCPICLTHHDRDINAAINLLKPNRAGSVRINVSGDRSTGMGLFPCETTVIERETNREDLHGLRI